MTASYDVVVVGAGFAGLACARRIGERGLSVLVLDRQPSPGARIHTTGILVREAWTEWAVPPALVRRISRVRVYTPSLRFVELERDDYFFMATDTPRLMQHLVEDTRRAGAEIRFKEKYQGTVPGRMPLTLEGSGVTCRFLVGADGAKSKVAESFGLDRNTEFLKGVEREYERTDTVADCLHCFVDPKCAPGYIGWVVPGVTSTQVGLALHRRRRVDLNSFVERIDPLFRLSERKELGKRGGIIPIGGLLRNFYADRVLLLGDAAGMVSPFTAGGIHHAYRFGRLAGDAIADHLRTGGPHPGAVVRRAYPNHRLKHLARWSFDHLPVAAVLDAGLVSRNLFRRVAAQIFFGRM